MFDKLSDIMLPASTAGGFKMEGYWVWCGSVVRGDDGNYHMFASRWKKDVPMHPGWLIKSEIVRAVSKTPEGPFEFCEVVLSERGPQYWDGKSTHNPHIKKINGKYVLYYMGTTYPFPTPEYPSTNFDTAVIVARANKRIGIATSKSIFGPWKRNDKTILDTRPANFDNYFTSNPAPCVKENGEIVLIYKTRSYVPFDVQSQLIGSMQFGVAKAKAFDGKYEREQNNQLFENNAAELEDPFVWYDNGYHLIAKDMTGSVCGEKYGGMYAHSNDGLKWKAELGKLFYTRDILFDDGVVRKMGNLERPFILFEDGNPICAYFAVSNGGEGGFVNASETWNLAIRLNTATL